MNQPEEVPLFKPFPKTHYGMSVPSRETLLKLVRFMAVGIPAFLIAIPLNVFFVENLHWQKAAAYGLVLVVQVTLNFFACVLFVFQRDLTRSLPSQFALFMSGILGARALDWALYSFLVTVIPFHYLVIQLFNVVVFSLAKFALARRALEVRTRNVAKS